MRNSPKRARSYRKRKRRQAAGWRQRERLEEQDREEAAAGQELRRTWPGRTYYMNHQTLTGRFSNDYT